MTPRDQESNLVAAALEAARLLASPPCPLPSRFAVLALGKPLDEDLVKHLRSCDKCRKYRDDVLDALGRRATGKVPEPSRPRVEPPVAEPGVRIQIRWPDGQRESVSEDSPRYEMAFSPAESEN